MLIFFLCHPQSAFVNGKFVDMRLTHTSSPQGGCLSPFLYIMYTDSCRSAHADRFLVKFADDSALLSLLFGSQQDHVPALLDFVEWCDDSYLKFYVSKTKKIVIEISENTVKVLKKNTIHDQEVEIVTKYKYLGTVFDNKLRWDDNTEVIVKKCQQRLYFLRKLNLFSVDKTILNLFYKSFIESVLCSSFICWYFNLSVKNKNKLQNIVRVSSKIIGETQRDIIQFCEQHILRKARSVLANDSHALYPMFDTLPSGRSFRCLSCKINRKKLSIVPAPISLLNNVK